MSLDWTMPVAYDATRKRTFHATGLARMRKLAGLLGLRPGTYDVRSNKGGIAVSGEVTLHGESIYVQAAQSCGGPNTSILIRRCEGRRDYTGGPNNFAPIVLLDDLPTLARVVSAVMNGRGR